jgi:hypothetical protein
MYFRFYRFCFEGQHIIGHFRYHNSERRLVALRAVVAGGFTLITRNKLPCLPFLKLSAP